MLQNMLLATGASFQDCAISRASPLKADRQPNEAHLLTVADQRSKFKTQCKLHDPRVREQSGEIPEARTGVNVGRYTLYVKALHDH